MPDDTTLIRWAGPVQPETLAQFNQRLTSLATQLQVTRGRKLRTDGTVGETNIQAPGDSRLLSYCSLFELHSAILRRGKVAKAVEYGHKVWLGEVEGGIVSSRPAVDGNPSDKNQWRPSLEAHEAQYNKFPLAGQRRPRRLFYSQRASGQRAGRQTSRAARTRPEIAPTAAA